MEHLEPKDVHRSALNKYPALYWFATGKRAEDEPTAADPALSSAPVQPVTKESKARGSADPLTPRSDSSREIGAGGERIFLKGEP